MGAVPRGVRKHILTLLLAALFAVGLAACGSSDDSTTGATTAAPTASGDQGSSGGESKQGGAEDGSRDGASGAGDSASSSDGSSDDSGPADEGSAAFREPGGDNSIQNYGDEAEPTDLKAAEKTLASYMDARAQRDWTTACRYLGNDAVKPLEELSKQSPTLKGKDCAQLLTAVTGKTPAEAFVNTFRPPVASLRHQGNRAFALYHGPQGVDYFMVMVKEGDEWKVSSISPSEFPGSG